jgi:serine/threonine protein kinase
MLLFARWWDSRPHTSPPTDLMHRDVKPENILLKADGRTIKLIDFGICRSFSTAEDRRHRRPLSGQTGSFRYMAPEIAAERATYEYTCCVDVYSGAMVSWFIHTGERPYSNLPGHQVAELAHRVTLRPSAASVKNEHLAALLMRAWESDPAARPSADEMESRLQELYEKSAGKGVFKGMAVKIKEGMSNFNFNPGFARLKSLERVSSAEPAGARRSSASPASDTPSTPESASTTLTYSQLKRHARCGHSCSPGLHSSSPATPEPSEALESFLGRRASGESCATTLRQSSSRTSDEFVGELSGATSASNSLSSSRDGASPPEARAAEKTTCEQGGFQGPEVVQRLPQITQGLGPYARHRSLISTQTCAVKGPGGEGPPSLTAESRVPNDGADSDSTLTLQKPVCVWRA